MQSLLLREECTVLKGEEALTAGQIWLTSPAGWLFPVNGTLRNSGRALTASIVPAAGAAVQDMKDLAWVFKPPLTQLTFPRFMCM